MSSIELRGFGWPLNDLQGHFSCPNPLIPMLQKCSTRGHVRYTSAIISQTVRDSDVVTMDNY